MVPETLRPAFGASSTPVLPECVHRWHDTCAIGLRMAGHYHNGMDLLTAKDAERIYRVTDQLQLHRDWVVVPLGCAEAAFEIVQPDGKLLVRPPGGEHFEAWIDGLASRLSELDLSRTARLGIEDPMKSHAPRARGTRSYLEDPKEEN